MYAWRRMTPQEQEETLEDRVKRRRPWHSPPHRYLAGCRQYLISAACYEHEPIIALSAERLDHFSDILLDCCGRYSEKVYAWCVLPDHYHVLLQTKFLRELLAQIALLHGRTSYLWNGEEARRGRKVWFNYVDREMRSHSHLMSTINYVHHNPVKHGLVERWREWTWSSADKYLQAMGRERACENWTKYPR